MTNRIVIAPTDDILHTFQNQLAAVGAGQARVALARAVNRTANTAHGRVVRALSKQSSIPVKYVRRAVKKKLAAHKGTGDVHAMLYARGYPMPLKYLKATQFKFGVKATLWGERRSFKGMFIWAGHYKSGKAVGSGHVFQRTTSKSRPIELQSGPSISEELIRAESLRQWETTVQTMLPQRIRHELGRMLNP